MTILTGHQRRAQTTTVLLVDEHHIAEAAAICSLLGDYYKAESLSDLHVVRVVTSLPQAFLIDPPTSRSDNHDNKHSNTNYKYSTCHPIEWRSHEIRQRQFLGPQWITHKGAPDGVYELDELEQAILGRTTPDDGGLADNILICTMSLEWMERLAMTIQSIFTSITISSSTSHPCRRQFLMLGTTGSFRTLDWLTRRVTCGWNPVTTPSHLHSSTKPLQPKSQHPTIIVSGFTSPLLYCRFVAPNMVVAMPSPTTTSTITLLVRSTSHNVSTDVVETWNDDSFSSSQPQSCLSLWNALVQRLHFLIGTTIHIVSLRSPLDHEIVRQPLQVRPLESGVHCLLYQLEDLSMIIFPCLFSTIQKPQSPTTTESRILGRRLLSMVLEIYKVLYQCIHSLQGYSSDHGSYMERFQKWMLQDSMLSNLVGSDWYVHVTNNSTYEIFERIRMQQRHRRRLWQMFSNSCFIRQAKFLEFLIGRHVFATYHWLVTSHAPQVHDHYLLKTQSITFPTNDRLPVLRYTSEALSHGLLLILGIGELVFGSNVQYELLTILNVVRQVQTMHGSKCYVQSSGNGLQWNTNAIIGDGISCPRVFGLTHISALLTFLGHTFPEVKGSHSTTINQHSHL